MIFSDEKIRQIRIIFDIEIDFKSHNFAIFDNFYPTDRKTWKQAGCWFWA